MVPVGVRNAVAYVYICSITTFMLTLGTLPFQNHYQLTINVRKVN